MNVAQFFKSVVVSAAVLFSVQGFASSTAMHAVSDTAITGMVKSKIALDQSLSNANLAVSTNDGVVTLKGTVKTDSEADAAVSAAESISSVKDVNTSHLKVAHSEHLLKDTYITAKVKGLFLRHKVFGDKSIDVLGISVETTNGIVSLTGVAETMAQINNAVKIAKSVKGVVRVENRIKLAD